MAEIEEHPIVKRNWRMMETEKKSRLDEIYTLVINHDVFNHSCNKISEGYQIKKIYDLNISYVIS